jgi:hypothetical protein
MASDPTVKKGGAAVQVTDKLSLDQIEQYFKNELPNWKRGPVQIARVRSGEESISSLRADLASRIAYDM